MVDMLGEFNCCVFGPASSGKNKSISFTINNYCVEQPPPQVKRKEASEKTKKW
jgi:hypothetical protein